ncbi:MAG: radical SAM protein [Deltaproteobacteria bacterium]|nr:radical SAM protein [Deltaproteobacteria bacterium]
MKKTVAFSKNSTNVFFHILTRCNLRCRHCYINPAQHGDNTLPIATIIEWLRLFYTPGRDANLVLLGGEPTLHPDLAAAVTAARDIGYASVTIDTNGYLFNDILDRVSPDMVDFFSFSLDGPEPAINDPIRGEGSFDRCVAGIGDAVARSFSTSLIFTASAQNIASLVHMPPLLRKLGVKRFFIQIIGIRGRLAAGGEDNLQVSRQDWEAIVPGVASQVAESGITVTWPRVFLGPDEVFECAGKVAGDYFIFPNGRVYRCPLCEDFPIHSMEIRDGRLIKRPKITETDLFDLDIAEGCVMNRLIQGGNVAYGKDGACEFKIACCLLKEEMAVKSRT